MFGAEKLYEGGLSVRTTLDPELQKAAREKLHAGLIKFDQARGFRGPVTTIDIAGDWGEALGKAHALAMCPKWRLRPSRGQRPRGFDRLHPGAPLAIGALAPDREIGENSDRESEVGEGWRQSLVGPEAGTMSPCRPRRKGARFSGSCGSRLRSRARWWPWIPLPVACSPWSADSPTPKPSSTVRRRPWRQPGSSFKPFVYAAALDNGYTPSSVIMDAPLEIQAGNETWRPENYGGKFYGPSTLRTGIEKSRNVMTVRLAQDMGMPLIVEYSKRFGIYDDLGAVSADVARRRRDHRHAHGDRLFDNRQRWPQDQRHPDRPHSGPVRAHNLPA
jgi:penicillin-binding protein 1A